MPISRKFLVRALGVAVMPLFLAACGPDAQQRADLDAVERSGTSPAIYDKMVHEDPLSLSDIVSLTHARVNDGVILRYIRDQGTVYYLHREDFRYLHDNGVSQSVVDYMASTSPNYWGPGPYPFYGPYGGPGAYYGPGPYGPVIPIGIGIGIGGGGGYHRGWR
jgi:hypothetical protein